MAKCENTKKMRKEKNKRQTTHHIANLCISFSKQSGFSSKNILMFEINLHTPYKMKETKPQPQPENTYGNCGTEFRILHLNNW